MRLFSGIFACILALLLAAGPASSQPVSAPYLYYFSEERHAFVIERADGTDSRLLGQGIIPINAVGADGAWSASGEYFAWATRKRWIESVDPRQSNEAEEAFGILRSDGSPVPLDLPEGIWRHRFTWSPTGDRILLTLQSGNRSPSFYLVINPNDGRISQPFSFDEMPEVVSQPGWTADGNWLVLTYGHGRLVDNEYKSFEFMRAVHQDGQIRELPIGCRSYCTSGRLPPPVSTNNDLLFVDPSTDRWSLYNLDADTFTPVDVDGEPRFTLVNWSPDGEYTLLRGGARTWLLDGERHEMRDVGGQSNVDDYDVRDPWSPDGRYAAWPSPASIWDRETNETVTFLVPDVHQLIWSNDSQSLMVVKSDVNSPAVLIDATTQEETILSSPFMIQDAFPSSDDALWGLSNCCEGRPHILNVLSGDIESYDAPAIDSVISPLPLFEMDWLWHADSAWFIVAQMAILPAGGTGPWAYTVYHRGQPQGRNLAYNSGHAAWLPDAAAQQLGLAP